MVRTKFFIVSFNQCFCIDDCVIPKGTNLALSIMSLHRNKNVYSNPKQFNPDNFLPEEIRKRNPLNFLPFSAGYRACIGITKFY